MKWPNSLPIDQFLPLILQKTKEYQNLILQSGPGTGKTTRIPLCLGPALPQDSGKIIVLVPRRLAAKMAAQRMAETLGEEVGQSVGYAFRLERKECATTKVLVVTEGTFIKMIQNNPNLYGIGLVILDEFHERHTQTDLALILIKEIQKNRPELKMLIMSATLDCQKLLSLLGEECSSVIEIPIQSYAVEIKYLPHRPEFLKLDLNKKIYNAFCELEHLEGDILIFLPGMKEILNCRNYFEKQNLADCVLLILHGDLSKEEQFLVMRPDHNGRRKIIISSNLAESSITIPGVSIVLDSGLKRELNFSPWSGQALLETKKVSKFSAIQRAGRAGRESAGTTFRLYSEIEYKSFLKMDVPEILRSDLSLELLTLMEREILVSKIAWLDSPQEELIKHALKTLDTLDAIKQQNGDYQITDRGREILSLPLNLRLARVVIEIVARKPKNPFLILKKIFDEVSEHDIKVRNSTENYLKKILKEVDDRAEISPYFYLMFGFIDRLARLRIDQKDFITQDGECLKLSKEIFQDIEDHALWIVLETGTRKEVTHTVPVEEYWIYEFAEKFIVENEICHWNNSKGRLELLRKTSFGQIVLEEEATSFEKLSEIKKEKYLTGFIEIKRKNLSKIWTQFENLSIYARLYTMINDLALTCIPAFDFFASDRDFLEFEGDDEGYYDFFTVKIKNKMLEEKNDLNFTMLESFYPFSVELKTGKKLKLTYALHRSPTIEGLIQDFYGTIELPLIGINKIKLSVILLGPHKRPLQVTQDLKNFWQTTYKELYKELSSEYPRYYWPQTPESAKPIMLKKFLVN